MEMGGGSLSVFCFICSSKHGQQNTSGSFNIIQLCLLTEI